MPNNPTSDIRHPIFLVALILALALLPHGVVRADGITVTANDADYAFAQQMTFHIAARSDAEIRSAVVVFRSGNGPEHRGQAAFAPGNTIDITHVQQLTGGVLPPFNQVTFWWELSDAAGHTQSTPHQTIDYRDNRFTWQEAAEGNVHVLTYAGDAAYAQSALSVARAALVRVNGELAAPLPPRVDVYLYASLDDLQSALHCARRFLPTRGWRNWPMPKAKALSNSFATATRTRYVGCWARMPEARPAAEAWNRQWAARCARSNWRGVRHSARMAHGWR
jgi:hypothetical protein